jgi:hypothetical protein
MIFINVISKQINICRVTDSRLLTISEACFSRNPNGFTALIFLLRLHKALTIGSVDNKP